MTGSENIPREETSTERTEPIEERRERPQWQEQLKPIAADDEEAPEISQELLDMYE